MRKLHIKTNPEVEMVFSNYPKTVRMKILNLRRLILETAEESEDISELEETLKWGEPSYLVKNGSTIRIDWKEKQPDHYAMYFKCTTKLISTFQQVYPKKFNFDGNRALVFKLDDEIPEPEIKNCIRAGLTYHKIKQLPLLGMR